MEQHPEMAALGLSLSQIQMLLTGDGCCQLPACKADCPAASEGTDVLLGQEVECVWEDGVPNLKESHDLNCAGLPFLETLQGTVDTVGEDSISTLSVFTSVNFKNQLVKGPVSYRIL